MVELRRAAAPDALFLQEMLLLAADWRGGRPRRAVAAVLGDPLLARYIDAWPKPGDLGVVAEAGVRVGAAWWRFFSDDDHGYGFLDSSIPEISIAVHEAFRGQGIGRLLLATLIRCADAEGVPALSLSVESDNPAVRLYRRVGFDAVRDSGDSLTMVVRLSSHEPNGLG